MSCVFNSDVQKKNKVAEWKKDTCLCISTMEFTL